MAAISSSVADAYFKVGLVIEAGIDDGDLVVVKKQVEANEGDIVVALVDNQNTLKPVGST